MQRGNYLCKASDAVKLAAIHYYVWHGPYDESKEQFSLTYMRELRLGEQLMPTPLVTAQSGFDWEGRIQKEQVKISEIFAKLSGGRGISSSEAKVMYIKKVRKLQMYGTTLFHVHNSKIFPVRVEKRSLRTPPNAPCPLAPSPAGLDASSMGGVECV